MYAQSAYDIRCEWGAAGVKRLAGDCNVLVIVDVLSFSTCVSVVVQRRCTVFPYRTKDQSKYSYAESIGAAVAEPRGVGKYSLSPPSLASLPPRTRIVLPSPNGATLTLIAGERSVLAGCLRNSRATAIAAQEIGPPIGVIPCGERWAEDDSLRPAIEDLIGAGAIIRHLQGRMSPEALGARAVFEEAQESLLERMLDGVSGRELVIAGYAEDVRMSSCIDVDDEAAVLVNGAFVSAASRGEGERPANEPLT